MNRFDFEKDYQSLYEHANKLCNTIDTAAIAAHNATNGGEHDITMAKGKVAEAFSLVSASRTLLREAAEVLDKNERCVKSLKVIVALDRSES